MRRLLGFDLLHAWRNRRDLFDTDVVWTHTELEHLAVLTLWQIIPRCHRPKIIAQCVWLLDKWDRLTAAKRWLYKKLVAQADVLTVQSSESLKAAKLIFQGVRSHISLYGIDADAMVPAVRRRAHHPLRILSLGRDMHRDWDTLIAAVSGWEGCEVRIGAKSIDRRLAQRSKNIRLITPGSAELRELYKWADVVVVPLKSNLHVSGITVVAEAALSGVPVVCTDTGGMRDYFSADEVRYVPPNDAVAMRRALEELAADDGLRFSISRKAQEQLVKAELNTRARARRLADLSREMLSEKQIIQNNQGAVDLRLRAEG
jgi:glycosyltransferase involved in cell wall biosynthesis